MVEEFERIMAVRAHFILPDGRIGAAICSRRLSRVNWRLHHRGATGGMDASAKAQERWRDIGGRKRADVRIDLLPAWEPDRAMSNKAIKRAVSAAAGPIAVHIDNMLSDLPAWASHEEIASELVAELGIWSRHPEFVRFLTEALAARRSIRCLGSCST